jgi:argininosuccinate lyase
MSTNKLTVRLGRVKGFPSTPFFEGDERQELQSALSRDLQLHNAHVVMLAEQGIISLEIARAILGGLLNLEREGIGALDLDPSLGLYLSTEKYLNERIGPDVAGGMHTGRSRNDLEPAASRWHARERINEIVRALIGLKETLLEKAEAHIETIMPGYTHHSQQAQPITFAHFLLATHDAFDRDIQRLEQAYAVVNLSTLGGCALATTGFPINRERVAQLLGFDGLVENSLDATGQFDYLLQTTAAIAIAMSNLGRLTEAILLWNTAEFGMVELAAEYCSISSIMPQKRNPVSLEMIRGEAALVAGHLNSMMGILKAVPPGMGREPFYLERLFPSCANTAAGALATMAGIISTLTVKRDVMARRAVEGFATMTELADDIVRCTGLAFRQAHHIVALTTLMAVEASKTADEITSVMIDNAAREVLGKPLGLDAEMVRRALDPVENVRIRAIVGGPAPIEVRRMLEARKGILTQDRERLAKRKRRLAEAAAGLQRAVDAILRQQG